MTDKLILPPTDVLYARAMAHSAEIKQSVARDASERGKAAQRIADHLDLAVLKPTAKEADVMAACRLAEQYGIKSVCVTTNLVRFTTLFLGRVCAVIGFPHGNTFPSVKIIEAMLAMDAGAIELDVVINYGRFLDGDHGCVIDELEPIVALAHRRGVLVKAILETCYYTPDEIRTACQLCASTRVDFVKTSTGFGTYGALSEQVQVMLDAVKGLCQVKASGGINTYADAMLFLDMGCTRIGASKFLELLP